MRQREACQPPISDTSTSTEVSPPLNTILTAMHGTRRSGHTGRWTGAGLRRFPSREYGINHAWLTLVTIAADLLAWLRLLALPGTLKACEPKALRYRFLHIPARLTRGARRRHLRLPQSWPWVTDAIATFTNVMAIPMLT